MKTEIEVHQSTIDHSVVRVDFTEYDGVTTTNLENFQIAKAKLMQFIDEQGLGEYCSDVLLGEYKTVDTETYLADNLDYVVEQYLTIKIQEAA